MSSKEQIYDEQIAPILLKAGQIAKEHGIDFLTCVDISDNDDPYAIAETRCIDMTHAQAAMKLVALAILSKGNVDSLMIALVQDQKGKPHNSFVLSMLERMDGATKC